MDVKAFYDTIGGNYESAKLIMMNDAFIERMLAKFFLNNSYNDIIASYERKDIKAVFASVHSFKGVVGNLALTPLYEMASIITEATRDKQEANIDREISSLKEKYQFVVDTYNSLNK